MATTGDDDFLPEVWGLYALGSLYIVLRFAVRLRADGWKGFRLDDAFAIIALLAWTYTCAIIHITHYTGTIIDFTVAELVTFDQSKFDQVEYGSKLFLGSWYSHTTLMFSLNGIVVMLYQRIFFQRWQIWILRITSCLCVAGFCGLTLAFSLVCLPHHQEWQIAPPPPSWCTASPKIIIATSCVNAVADTFLLSVPIPLLWNLNKPLQTRIVVFILLASGAFIPAACIVRVMITIEPDICALRLARWGVREFCVAIVAVNTASLRPMFRESFWKAQGTSPVLQKCNNYILASAQQALQRFDRSQNHHQALEPPSAGASTTDVYIQLDLFDEKVIIEDSVYQMDTQPPHDVSWRGPRIVDLERGGAYKSEVGIAS